MERLIISSLNVAEKQKNIQIFIYIVLKFSSLSLCMELQKLNSYFRNAFENGSINNDEQTAMEIQVEPRKNFSSCGGYEINVVIALHVTIFCPTLRLPSRAFVFITILL